MPVIDMIRPIRADRVAGSGRADRVIADLGTAFRVRRDACAELHGQHLRAEADPEKRTVLAQRHGDPVDFAADIVVGIVGAHRSAENHSTGMVVQRLRQRVAETGAADVQRMAKQPQRVANPARCRGFLVQHDQHRPQIGRNGARSGARDRGGEVRQVSRGDIVRSRLNPR